MGMVTVGELWNMENLITQFIGMRTPCSIQHPDTVCGICDIKKCFSCISVIASPSPAPVPAVAWTKSSGSRPISLCTGEAHHGEPNGYGGAYSLSTAANYETLECKVSLLDCSSTSSHNSHTFFKLTVTWDWGVSFTGGFLKIFCNRKYHCLFHQEINVKYHLQNLSRPYIGLCCNKTQLGYRWDKKLCSTVHAE